MSKIQELLSFIAVDFEPYFQSQVPAELERRGHSVINTNSKDYGPCQLVLCDAAIIYLPPFEEKEKIESFLENQIGCGINTIGLTQSHKEKKLYQQHFSRMHLESLMDVVVPRSCSEIAEGIEKKIVCLIK